MKAILYFLLLCASLSVHSQSYYLDCVMQMTNPPKEHCDTVWRIEGVDNIYREYRNFAIQQPEPQIMWIITFEDLLDYQKECYNDSTAYYGNGIDNKVWIHREPTFADFIEWIKKIQASRNEQN